MNMKELLAGRAVVSIENEVTDEKNLIYQLAKEVLKASNNEIKFSSILSIGGDENHDSYELNGNTEYFEEMGSGVYCLDPECTDFSDLEILDEDFIKKVRTSKLERILK